MEFFYNVITILLVLTKWSNLTNGACDTIRADVIFLIDSSGSVRAPNFAKELNFAVEFARAFQIGPSSVQIGVVTFSNIATEAFKLNTYTSVSDVEPAIRKIFYEAGTTATHLGLRYVMDHGFTTTAGDRPEAPNIVILLTDGKSNEASLTNAEAQRLRNSSVEIYAIGIGDGIESAELQTVATDPQHVHMVNNFDDLSGFLTTLKDSLCMNPCFSIQCLHGGSCQQDIGAAFCQCVAGYTGQHCDSDIDEFATASRYFHGAACIKTESHIDECSTYHPCHHGATCHNTAGSYKCTCTAGYIGQLCSIDTDECSTSNPCLNGATCTNTLGSYICRCVSGYNGFNCETDIDECATGSPCLHGTCINKPGSYSCQCNPGYQGSHCQSEANECLSLPCQNGGVCFDGDNDYTCDCNSGFTGKNCEQDINECDTTPCQNGATCINGVNSYTCQCVPGYTGTLCQTEVDECVSHPCQHGGTCTDLFNDYNCTCREYVMGKNCEKDLCADVVPNCGEMFDVCHDQLMKTTICRGTCGVCGKAQIIFAGQTQATTAATVCIDMIPDCGSRWGVCRDHTMAETKCRKTCGVCGDSEVVFG